MYRKKYGSQKGQASLHPAAGWAALGQENNPEWKTVAWDETRDQLVVPRGSIGFRWGETGDEVGKWNLESLDAAGTEIKPLLSLVNHHDKIGRAHV